MYRRASEVLDHDYRSDAIGTAVPYGIHDVNRNHGTVVVGDSRETAAVAPDVLERWWALEGRQAYPDAKSLLWCWPTVAVATVPRNAPCKARWQIARNLPVRS